MATKLNPDAIQDRSIASIKLQDGVIPSESTVSGWGFTKNAGTITGITMNGASKGTSGVVNLGTVITDVSGKADSSAAIGTLSLSINSSNYQITLSGTKVDGTTFTVSDVIDLPLESVVVSGSYDDTTQKVILTLKNGSTIDFSIADLIDGLQSEITSSNKLSADLIEDGTTNKTVTATEKQTWNSYANVQADWEQDTTTEDDYILNKPAIKAGTGTNSIIGGNLDYNIASSSTSISIGEHTIASGQATLATGFMTKADSASAFATGTGTYALGQASFSSGTKTAALGDYSHAEGVGNTNNSTFTVSGAADAIIYTTNIAHNLKVNDVVGYGVFPSLYVSKVTGVSNDGLSFNVNKTLSSTALSNATIRIFEGGTALGNQSHTEGSNTVTIGNYSHAEGSSTKAVGSGSHAEGGSTVTNGISSHAEGIRTTTNGNYSHAEGQGTITENQYEHAQGNYNKSNIVDQYNFGNAGNTISSIGIGTSGSARKNAVEVMQNGDVYVYGVGEYDGTNPNTTGVKTLQDAINDSPTPVQSDWNETTTTDLDYILNKPAIIAGTGTNSIISGDLTNNIASGTNSHADGSATVATLEASHSEGMVTEATGYASHSEGMMTYAVGQNAHSEGFGSVAYGQNSHAEGGGENGPTLITSFKVSGAANVKTYTTNVAHNLKINDIISCYDIWPCNVSRVTGISNDGLSFTVDNTLSSTALSNTNIYKYTNTAIGTSSHSEGSNTKATGSYSHAEGSNTVTNGSYSHAEGSNTVTNGISSHAEGNSTITENDYEHAQGRYNKSNRANSNFGNAGNTINSIGIGTLETARKNAVEVMQNGDVYVYGVGSYDGTNPTTADTLQDAINNASMDLATPITYSALVTLKSGGNLVPGMQYRITDYTCTTTQTDTQSAGHVFDIIVTADSATELNENARAAHHSGDTYFQNCDLDSWELKYCLENDTNRFYWADSTNGKGVIYYMKDEWNNECPYDFKNIQFRRWAVMGYTKCPDLVAYDEYSFYYGAKDINGTKILLDATYDEDEEGYNGYFYTFAFTNYDNPGVWFDYTVAAYSYDNAIVYCSDNHIGKFMDIYEDYDIGDIAILNNNVFFNYCDGGNCTHCSNNRLLYNCRNNTFGSDSEDNLFGSDFKNNTFGNACQGNTFGNYCNRNTFGDGCQGNTFRNDCYQNTLLSYCSSNTFGDSSYDNSLGNECCINIFGNNCNQNTFGNYCYSNSFENSCNNNSFGNYCQSNTVFDGVWCCSITGGSQSAPVKNAQILNGTKGTSTSNKLTITFEANKDYTQVAGLVNGTDLRIWIAEDTVTGPSTSTGNNLAAFDGTTGKVIKDSGVALSSLSNLVHTTGNETITGKKTFTTNTDFKSGVSILNSSGTVGTYMISDTTNDGKLGFYAAQDDSAVQLQNIATPTNNSDAANKSYVDGQVATKYTKPSGGIPSTDLTSAVQTSLGKADTALQSYTETDPVFTASAAHGITSSDITNWNNKTSNVGTITGITMNGASKGTSGVVNLGTVITSETALSKGTTTGSGNAVTDISVNGHEITLTKGTTFLTEETDPVFGSSAAASITSSQINAWDAKVSANNGTLTIQKNGTQVATFSANQTTNQTANIQVNELPSVSASDNGKILMVVNGAWSLVTPVSIYSGTSTPDSSLGDNGDLYIQTNS